MQLIELYQGDLKKGDSVMCLYAGEYSFYLTKFKTYEVIAGVGDEDIALGGVVNENGFNIICDRGFPIYCSTNYIADEGWSLVSDTANSDGAESGNQ